MTTTKTNIPCPYCGEQMQIFSWQQPTGKTTHYPYCDACCDKIASGFDSEAEAREFVSRRAER